VFGMFINCMITSANQQSANETNKSFAAAVVRDTMSKRENGAEELLNYSCTNRKAKLFVHAKIRVVKSIKKVMKTISMHRIHA
jgi:hypothetical protein